MTVHSTRLRGNNLTVSHNATRLTLSREWGGGNDVFNYDLSGRPWNMFLEDISYQRGLDNRIVGKWVSPERNRQRRWLTPHEADELVKLANQTAKEFLELTQSQDHPFEPALTEEAQNCLQRAADYDLAKAHLEADRFQDIYLPVGILPPDQYMAVLLQATEGCSFNQCTFCRFYDAVPFRIKPTEEFEQHARQVREYLGEGLSARRSIFLGDANALVSPTKRLLEHLQVVQAVFDVRALGGVYAFLDGFSGEKKSEEEYRRLAANGLTRVYLGLESGHDPLLRFLNKPGSARDAVDAVHKMKDAGISVGIIILLGAGGHRFAEGHVQDTISALDNMQLDLHDQIYFSQLLEQSGTQYSQDAFAEQLDPLSNDEIEAQWSQIQVGLHFTEASGTPHMARYDIREFIY